MNNSLQNLVANYYERLGYNSLSINIRAAKNDMDIKRVVCSVLKKLMKSDPNGFGQDVKNLCMERATTNGKN